MSYEEAEKELYVKELGSFNFTRAWPSIMHCIATWLTDRT